MLKYCCLKVIFFCVFLFIFLFSFLGASRADFSKPSVLKKDMQVIGKALGFLEEGPKGNVLIDVIYSEGDPVSSKEADEIVSLLSDGLHLGKITLTGQKTTRSRGAKIAYLTTGTSTRSNDFLKKGVITVSANPECAIAGHCVLGVSTSPKVEIHLNSAAANLAETSFSLTFLMMVTEH